MGMIKWDCRAYWELMRFHRPIGTVLLLWPTLWALFLAARARPSLSVLSIFILGVIVMRAFGCVMNDYFDRHIDRDVMRTRDRPLASGRISARAALITAAVLSLVALLLWCFLTPLAQAWSFVALGLALIYPLMKRFFILPQMILGLAFAFGIPLAFAELQGQIPKTAWVLYVATGCWIFAYDTIYALSDLPDDSRLGVHSSARFFGSYWLLAVIAAELMFIVLMAWVGYCLNLAWPYQLSVLFVASLFFIQLNKLTKIYQLNKNDQSSQSFQSSQKIFRQQHWVGLIIFMGIVLGIFLR